MDKWNCFSCGELRNDDECKSCAYEEKLNEWEENARHERYLNSVEGITEFFSTH